MGRKVRKGVALGIVLDTISGEPMHRQIGAQLRSAILERRLLPGALLPSSRLMAAELHCARGTVLAAIDHLVAEGYLVSRTGSGVAVGATLPDAMLAAPSVAPTSMAMRPPALPQRTRSLPPGTADPAGLTAFPIGQPDREAFPFATWAKLLEREWRRPGWAIAGTPHPFGHPGLQQAIAQHLGVARGFVCAPEDVVVTAGIRQSVALFARVVLEAGEEAWIEDPGYPGMQEGLEAAGVRAVPVPIDGSGFSVAAALGCAPGARLAVVAPSHHFPLGTVLTLQRRLELLHWAERSGGWIAEDDFDGEYRYSGRPLAPLRALDRTGRVAYFGSFSKILFPALRLSFLVLPPGLVDATRRVMVLMATGASLLGQGALARFIADGHLAVHLRRTRLLYGARQEMLLDAATRHLAGQLHIDRDPGGMHLIARPATQAGFDDARATRAAAMQGVQVGALSSFYQMLEPEHGLILGYAGTPEQEIDSAVRRLSAAL